MNKLGLKMDDMRVTKRIRVGQHFETAILMLEDINASEKPWVAHTVVTDANLMISETTVQETTQQRASLYCGGEIKGYLQALVNTKRMSMEIAEAIMTDVIARLGRGGEHSYVMGGHETPAQATHSADARLN